MTRISKVLRRVNGRVGVGGVGGTCAGGADDWGRLGRGVRTVGFSLETGLS